LRKLSEVLKGPIGFAPHLGLPGFHIFLSNPGFSGLTDEGIEKQVNHADWLERTRDDPSFVSSPVHIDTAHLIVEWPQPTNDVDFDHPISFTISIDLPQVICLLVTGRI